MKYPPIKNWKSCNQANVQFNQSQISSDRLNIFELGCLLHLHAKKESYSSCGFLLLWIAFFFFFMSLGFADVSGLIFERMGQIFSRSNFFVKFVFLLMKFDSLTRWLMIPWQERLIIVLFPHRAIYHNCGLLMCMLLYVWKLAFLTWLACAKFKRILTYKRGQKG